MPENLGKIIKSAFIIKAWDFVFFFFVDSVGISQGMNTNDFNLNLR